MLIDFIAGKVSDLYKLSPIIYSIQHIQESGSDIGYRLIFTGSKEQLYTNSQPEPSTEMPGVYLDVTDTNHAANTAKCLVKYEQLLHMGKPDITMLFGRNNSVTGCALAAAKTSDIRVAHIGSGIRNNVRHSSDEVNGRIIDAITDYHFPIAQSSCENLRKEGISDDYIFFTGNPVSDMLASLQDNKPEIWNVLQLQSKRYYLVHIDNPALLESASRLKPLLLNLIRYTRNQPVVCVLSDNNRKAIKDTGVKAASLHYADINDVQQLYYLVKHAKAVVTDSENLQDETTYLQVPCMTLFKSVLLPDTATSGTNEVIGLQPEAINDALNKIINGVWKKGHIPYLWDGKVAERITATLKNLI